MAELERLSGDHGQEVQRAELAGIIAGTIAQMRHDEGRDQERLWSTWAPGDSQALQRTVVTEGDASCGGRADAARLGDRDSADSLSDGGSYRSARSNADERIEKCCGYAATLMTNLELHTLVVHI